MSALNELIHRLCPEGVEYKKLGECCNILDNQRKPVTKSARIAGEYPYYGANGIQDYVADYIFDGTFVLVGEDGSVLTKAGTPVVTWAEGKIWVNNHAHIIEQVDGVLLRYLFHYIQTINISPLIHGNIPKLTGKDFKSLQIPLPPLPVQAEIVRILDSFTDLAAELQAELQARRGQYEYYRNRLLSFEESEVKWMKMSEIGTFFRGNGLQKKDFTDRGVPCIHYGQIYTYYGTFATKTKSFVSNETAKKCKKAHHGDLIITATSENIEDVAKTVAWLGDDEIAISNHTFIYSHNQNPKYIAYLFQTNAFFTYKKSKVIGVKVIDIPQKALENYLIPIPPLSEQERIVSILDRFEALTADLSEGLPAEIAAVQEQYEYYRNRLLSFPVKKRSA